eukprot:59272-Chlamydomonas_euryale.AAC.6
MNLNTCSSTALATVVTWTGTRGGLHHHVAHMSHFCTEHAAWQQTTRCRASLCRMLCLRVHACKHHPLNAEMPCHGSACMACMHECGCDIVLEPHAGSGGSHGATCAAWLRAACSQPLHSAPREARESAATIAAPPRLPAAPGLAA